MEKLDQNLLDEVVGGTATIAEVVGKISQQQVNEAKDQVIVKTNDEGHVSHMNMLAFG